MPRRLRRIVKDKGAFPNDSAIFKPLWLVGAPVDFFLLEAAPQALHIHIVEPVALAVYRDAHAVRLQRSRERLGGKLRSPVSVLNILGAP